MGEVVIESHRNVVSRSDVAASSVGLINLEKYRRSNSKASESIETLASDERSPTSTLLSEPSKNLSPEYKSSWADVHIQGDYDHYARSTAPGRRRRSEASPNKTENTPSPLPSTKTEKNAVQLSPRLSQQAKRQRRTRIKLSKPLIQLPIAVEAGQTRAGQNEWTTRGIAAAGEEKSIDTAGSRGCVAQEEVQETDRTKIPSAANTLSSKFLDRFTELGDGGLEWRQENTALDQFREENENGERKGASSTGASATKGSEKISQENSKREESFQANFSPPVAALIDFRPHGEAGEDWLYPSSQAVDLSFMKKTVKLEAVDGSNRSFGALSRQSALFLAKYLELGINPIPNMITSIVVKPILPPLKGRNPNVARRLKQNIWTGQLFDKTRFAGDPSPAATNTPKGKQLGPLRDAHRYGAKSKTLEDSKTSDKAGGRTPKQTIRRNDPGTIFDQVVRWRSKVRHCGNPVMYRKTISPTLGEMALRRKLTDRLPTRQNHWKQLPLSNLKSLEPWENWRQKPAVRDSGDSLHFQHRVNATYRPSVRKIGAFYNGTNTRKQSEVVPLVEATTLTTDIPRPTMPSRKRRPVWQRMR